MLYNNVILFGTLIVLVSCIMLDFLDISLMS